MPISNLPNVNWQLAITNCQIPITNCQLPITKWPKNISISSQFSYKFDSIELHSCFFFSWNFWNFPLPEKGYSETFSTSFELSFDWQTSCCNFLQKFLIYYKGFYCQVYQLHQKKLKFYQYGIWFVTCLFHWSYLSCNRGKVTCNKK